MGLLDKARGGITEFVLGKFGKDIGAGEYGAKAATAYKWVAGQGAFIGSVLALIMGALEAFQPDYASVATRNLGLVGLGLAAIGVLDKLRLKEPIFEPWFLEIVAHVSSKVTLLSGGLLSLDEFLTSYAPHLMTAKLEGIEDLVQLWLAAVVAACALINRFARASASAPPEQAKG